MIDGSPGWSQERETDSWVKVPVRPVGVAGGPDCGTCASTGPLIPETGPATKNATTARRMKRLTGGQTAKGNRLTTREEAGLPIELGALRDLAQRQRGLVGGRVGVAPVGLVVLSP